MPKLPSWLQGHSGTIRPELISLAAEVAAVVTSARHVLARAPEVPERGRLLDECEYLKQMVAEVVDPRGRIQDLTETQLDEAIEIFMQYRYQAGVIRVAALRLCGKGESRGLRARRRPG